MKPHLAGNRSVVAALVLTLALAAGLVVTGCGDKIAIPQPTGVFSLNQYVLRDSFMTEGTALQLTQGRGALYILTPGTLTKRDTGFGMVEQVSGLTDPRCLCLDNQGQYVFVWEEGVSRVSWYDAGSLVFVGASVLPDVQNAVAMATNPAGIGQVPGAETYLYLSDPEGGVIHRYAFSQVAGLTPHGILARSDGEGARFVHQAAGMATDSEDFLLVCDRDESRNWVIRFASTPDPTDISPIPEEPDPLRGFAAIFDTATCDPPAATDYVIGNAAECLQTDWMGGPSEAIGEFTIPNDVAVDGLGRIYVADTGNTRIQQFTYQGNFEIQFSLTDTLAGPTSLGVFDEDGKPAGTINYGGLLFVTLEGRDIVYKYYSYDHYQDEFGELPPLDQ